MVKVGKRSSGEADDDSLRDKKSKWSKPNRQPSQMGDVPDSEEDLGHSTKEKFMAAAKESARRSYTVVSNLKITVDEGKQKLVNSLEGKVLGVTKRENELADILIKVLLYAHQDQTELYERGIKHFSTSKPKASAIYRKAKFNITSSRELLGHYERASQQVTFPERVPIGDFGGEKDNQTLQRVLDRQREKIKLEVHQLLNRGPKSSKELAEGDLLKLDTNLWDHFAMGEKAKKEHVEALDGSKGETWAVVANNAQRGVRRAVKDLPENDECYPR